MKAWHASNLDINQYPFTQTPCFDQATSSYTCGLLKEFQEFYLSPVPDTVARVNEQQGKYQELKTWTFPQLILSQGL